jgi:hypothetical protein
MLIKFFLLIAFRLPNEEVKLIERKQLLDVISLLKSMLKRLSGNSKTRHPEEFCEKLQLNCAFQWLQVILRTNPFDL